MRLNEARAAYDAERRRARRRSTFRLLRHCRASTAHTEAEQIRLKAVHDELRDRGVALPTREVSR